MVSLIVAPVGFDERFIVRHLLAERIGLKNKDYITAFLPIEEEETRGLKVIDIVKEIAAKYKLNIEITYEMLNVGDFWGSASRVRKAIEDVIFKAKPDRLHILLGGGMRILGFEVFTGALAARDRPRESTVYVYREDMKGYVEFPLDLFTIERPPDELVNTLRVISELGSVTLTGLARKLEIAKSTLHNRIIYLERSGLVTVDRRGRSSKITLTERAKLWV